MKRIFTTALAFFALKSAMLAQCPVPNPVTATPATVCAGASTSLNATAAGASAIYWYTVAVGGSTIGTSLSGVNFPVVPVNTTTYYAESFTPGSVVTNSYNFTGALQSFTIPAGVTSISVTLRGAQGGSSGGQGGKIQCVFPVTPGDVLNIYVGGQGAAAGTGALGGFNGGGNAGVCNVNYPGSGGGGATDIRLNGVSLANRIIVAGGGGGTHQINGNPGAGGGLTGGNVTGSNGCIATYATGGSQVNGGNSSTSTGVCCTFAAAAPAALGVGGNGAGPSVSCNNGDAGAGGGGGYYGGGGGGGYSAGGGGSSYSDPLATNVVHTQGGQVGAGQAVIAYNQAPCISVSRTPITVTVNPIPTITVNSGSICIGQSFTMVPGGANTYTFQGGNAVVSPTVNASYTVVGTSSAGCVSSTFATAGVTVNATPIPTITANSGSICAGGSFTIVPGGGNTYTFQGGNAVVSPTATSAFTVVGSNSVGCISNTFATANVTVAALPSLSITGNNTICVGESTTLTANGANTYSWNTGASTSSIVASPTITTSYTTTGTSSLTGCANTISTTIVVNLCTGINTVSSKINGLSIYPNPGNGEFTVELNNGLTKAVEVSDISGKIVYTNTSSKDKVNVNITHLANGIYYLKVQSNNVTEVIKLIKQ